MYRGLGEIFLTFSKIGSVAYGGGPSMVPLLKAEVIEGKGWIGTDDFLDALAISNALPGPIITKMAAVVGYSRGGVGGALAAVLGIALPSAVVMLVLLGFVYQVRDNPTVASMLAGVRPVVVAMLAYAAWDMAPDAVKSKTTALIAVSAFLAMIFLPLHPALIIAIGAAVGLALKL